MNMSFYETPDVVLDHSKTQTRRRGDTWYRVKPGDRIQAVQKCQGLKSGEKIVVLAQIQVVTVRTERLDSITQADVIAEGFPDWTPRQFIDFFCKQFSYKPHWRVRVIVFRYVDDSTKGMNDA